ncbi:MAG TPA: DUF488 family protein [Acidimicrobiia bacterium]|nr:DUF488 family protein [Acidimicrobiia bacterium]
MPFSIHRIYEKKVPPGQRILVDRLWPRGVKKSEAGLDEWLKESAPSTKLRRWYGHAPAKYEEFARRYRAELARPPAAAAVEHLLDLARHGEVVLVTATRDIDHSGARVLLEHLTLVSEAS